MKNANKLLVETSSTKNKSRLLWDDFTFKAFVDACVLEYNRGNIPGTSFSKVGWANIINSMYEKTGKTFERKQITNKWDSMKKEWKLYDRLMRLETGIGGTRSFIDALPEWWEEKIKVDPNYAKFRGVNLEIFESDYATLFRDSVAVGDNAMTPIQFQNDVQTENIDGKGDIEFKRLCRIAVQGIIITRGFHNRRRPCHTSNRTCHMYVNEILTSHPRRCYEIFRLHVPVFRQLCIDLVTNYGLKQSRNMSVEESVRIFLMTLAHGCTNRFVQESFNHYGETIHRHFHKVMAAVLKMSANIIKPSTNYNDEVPAHILNNPRYYPMFKDCIGAIGGTHVRVSVQLKDQPKYIGRKGYAAQNIMAVCDLNMCFTFVWAGWEGSAHDTRIFNEALRRPELLFPHPMGDKYYVVDAGYPNTKGYLTPYKGQTIRQGRLRKSLIIFGPRAIRKKWAPE
ncbi:uncharacterized protein LOC110928996 [Helianthus annuus]|uniref:uncharacterized protein LOC110928996 n=1 Tax=Helianthus annuus TaxID=4232 RepID=UPI000B909AC0|nr:uncharacterized protein LOC110928996 [Helianthus annuus]